MNALAESWTFITAWYNLPFTLAVLAFLVLSALQFIGLDHDHDADVHANLDHDLDQNLDLDHDAGFDHELDHDLDQNMAHDISHEAAELPAWATLLHFLGVGQAPLTMVVVVLVGGFGILGWVFNALVLDLFSTYPGWALLPVLAITTLIGIWFTSRAARRLGRAVPAFASTATSVKRLVGRRGYVSSPQVDHSYGQVKLRDPGGTSLTVFAVVDPGKPPVPRDAEVFLVEYDPVKKVFVVVPSE